MDSRIAVTRAAPALTAPELLDIIRLLPDVIFRCQKGQDGVIRWTLNEGRLAEEFHITTKDIYGKSLDQMFPPEVAARQLPFFEAAFRGEGIEWVNELGGRLFKHHPQPVYGPDGKISEVVGFISEVTNLVAAQDHAKQLNGELLERLVQLRQANDGLERANRDLDGFAASVSHDLRNPLAVIANLEHVLESRLDSTLDDASRADLQKIARAVRRMTDLTTDLLRFSRASQGQVHAETYDLSAAAHEVVQALRALEPSRRVAVTIEPGILVTGDCGLLRAALDNLLANAWKYTGQAAQARIAVRSERDPAGRLIVAIEDNGIGFSNTDAPNLFQPFHRLPGSETFAGTGMGLVSVRRIVERHGGRIWAEGRPGSGATFRFTLAPAAAAA